MVRGNSGTGYEIWIQEASRAKSRELEFGAWWVMEGTHWRVAWIEDTGELYAAEQATDRFLLLGHFTRRDIHTRMRAWFSGDDLNALIQHLQAKPAR